jgi:hypothetical protein
MDEVREAVSRLLQGGEVDPRATVVAAMAGELAASMARADESELDALLTDLADALRRAGLEHSALIELVPTPMAGSA